jgi:hypothetical protein
MKVVRESAQRLEDALGIPPQLVLDALAFDRALAEQVVDVEGEAMGHVGSR